MNQVQWYYSDSQQQRQGPVAALQLRQLFEHGHLSLSSVIWREGMEQWQPLQSFAEEFALPAANDSDNPYATPTAAILPTTDVYVDPKLDERLQPYAAFVGKNFETYRRKWRLDERVPQAGETWHWPAFFCGVSWMLYRKMYGVAVIWASAALAWGALNLVLELSAGLVIAINIGISILAGCIGNWLYLRHAQKVIAQVSARHKSSTHRLRAELGMAGGTNGAAVVIGILVMIGANLLVGAVLS
jgi:hypothetical protein